MSTENTRAAGGCHGYADVTQTGEELTNRRFRRAAPPQPPKPPQIACTSAAQAGGVTYVSAGERVSARRALDKPGM